MLRADEGETAFIVLTPASPASAGGYSPAHLDFDR
jgi:hypothetical protein